MLPLADNIHKLFIDIYSNVIFPKPMLQVILYCTSCLTLFEDLPYFNELANGNSHRWVRATKASNRDPMQLFKRFVELYGSKLELHLIGSIHFRTKHNYYAPKTLLYGVCKKADLSKVDDLHPILDPVS